IGVVSTRLLFWVLFATMYAVGRGVVERDADDEVRHEDRAGWRPSLTAAALVSALLVTVGYAFLTPVLRPTTAIEVALRSYLVLPRTGAGSPGLLSMWLAVWLVAGTVDWIEEEPRSRQVRWIGLAQ